MILNHQPLKIMTLSGLALRGLLCFFCFLHLFPCFFRQRRSIFTRGHMNKPRNGTPYYISPEVWKGKPFTTSSDMWSMGCVLFEICALQVPFPGNRVPEIAKRNLGPVSFRPKKAQLVVDVWSPCCWVLFVSATFFLFPTLLSYSIPLLCHPIATRCLAIFIHVPHSLRFHPSTGIQDKQII